MTEVDDPFLHEQGTEGGEKTRAKAGVEESPNLGRIGRGDVRFSNCGYVSTLLDHLHEQCIGKICRVGFGLDARPNLKDE